MAKNRKKRYEQDDNSLETWIEKVSEERNLSQKEISKIRTSFRNYGKKKNTVYFVKKGARVYFGQKRIVPGSVFFIDGKRYVVDSNNGNYVVTGENKKVYRKNVAITLNNDGLVYL